MHVVVPNTTAATVLTVDPPPHPTPGREWHHEMINGQVRVYADTLADLVATLTHRGYVSLDPVSAYVARLRVAYTAEATHQAALLTHHEGVPRLTPEQRATLHTPRHDAPVVDRWDGPVPLVLTMDRHEPVGDAPRPLHDPGDVIWLDASSDANLLGSLHRVGLIVVADRVQTPAAH